MGGRREEGKGCDAKSGQMMTRPAGGDDTKCAPASTTKSSLHSTHLVLLSSFTINSSSAELPLGGPPDHFWVARANKIGPGCDLPSWPLTTLFNLSAASSHYPLSNPSFPHSTFLKYFACLCFNPSPDLCSRDAKISKKPLHIPISIFSVSTHSSQDWVVSTLFLLKHPKN